MAHVDEFDAVLAQRHQNRPSVAAVDRKQVLDALRLQDACNQGTAIDLSPRSRSGLSSFARQRHAGCLSHYDARKPVAGTSGICHVGPLQPFRAS